MRYLRASGVRERPEKIRGVIFKNIREMCRDCGNNIIKTSIGI
jgi:hypothetical protein